MSSLGLLVRLVALASLHTASALMSTSALPTHSRTVWDNKEMDGTRNRTLQPAPTVFSARRREVNVFPVPQAMISLPRSLSWKPVTTLSIASRWWGRGVFLSPRCITSGWDSENCAQSTVDHSRSTVLSLRTGICWFLIASSAF